MLISFYIFWGRYFLRLGITSLCGFLAKVKPGHCSFFSLFLCVHFQRGWTKLALLGFIIWTFSVRFFPHFTIITSITTNCCFRRTYSVIWNEFQINSFKFLLTGATQLSSSLSKVHRGLVKLSLSHCGLTGKGVAQIGHALSLNKFMASSLVHLDLSNNCIKDDITVPFFPLSSNYVV